MITVDYGGGQVNDYIITIIKFFNNKNFIQHTTDQPIFVSIFSHASYSALSIGFNYTIFHRAEDPSCSDSTLTNINPTAKDHFY
jgi:hypothetical protein